MVRPVVLGLVVLGACGRVNFATRSGDGGLLGDADARSLDASPEPIRFVQTHSDVIASASTLTTTFATDITAGSTIIVGVDFDHAVSSTEPTVTLTDNAGRIYQPLVGPAPSNSNSQSQYLFAAYAPTGGPSTVTAILSQPTVQFFELKAFEYAGIAMTSPVDVTSFTIGMNPAAGEVDAMPIVTTGTNEVVLALEVCDCSADGGPGMTVRSTFNTDVFEELLAPAPGSYVMKAVIQGAGRWRFVIAAFRGQ